MPLAEEASGLALFLPESYDLFWSAVILVILAAFFYFFFMPKFNQIFDERADKIQGGFDRAAQAQAEAEETKKQYEDQLRSARTDASKIREDARSEAARIVADAKKRAEAEAEQVSAAAQKSIEAQRAQALVSLKGEVGAIATALAGKILGSKLDSADVQSSMIDDAISELER
ncbi:F0F1 ATP synthase subunit B [Alloscardovia macacae]|uniref:ATP synthase subunit b n=1 Tax=Alloscardovia macacae TaxID=1160091 RepID=A0A1Y2T1I4_9BIFI|nr:F0F1 ATP synthase subunit B [Alloscardovia macacae]OTA26476.1 F0F1 ATP synthase subunit B [Alloscardovia macacae]OTA29846.1 F0F1 ATP synthase subunit B [Alloscardovia macacae]OZG53848.1 F0F1 ATP synthase subunit B [Alloscardovia macacae]